MGVRRGLSITITAADTDTLIANIPKTKVAVIPLIEIRNPTASVARIRIWDKYTIGTTAYSDLKADYDVPAGETVVIDTKEAKHAVNQLVAQSTVAGVTLYVGIDLT